MDVAPGWMDVDQVDLDLDLDQDQLVVDQLVVESMRTDVPTGERAG